MSINLGTYALVSALAVGGAVAQYQYSQPAGPPDPNASGATTEQNLEQTPTTPGYSSSPMGSSAGPVDCTTLMSSHQQMMQELARFDADVETRISQMRDAKSEAAKLDATAGVVELLATQRKQIRDRMMAMEHQTLQFMLTSKGQDLAGACPQLAELLRQGAMPGPPSGPGAEQGGPNDLEIGNDEPATSTNDGTTKPNDKSQNR